MKYYQIDIVKTAKPMGRPKNDNRYYNDWQTYDHQTEKFKTLAEVRAWLKNEYSYVKTIVKSYRDDKDGQAKESGFIYCFKSDPASYDDCHHFEQHWIDISLVHKTIINLK
jgi:hypothetical protein